MEDKAPSASVCLCVCVRVQSCLLPCADRVGQSLAECGMQGGFRGKEVAAPQGSPNFVTGVLNSSDRLLTLLL
jgi:hypothetical protein